ncbi:hypothetical protein PAXRUDRAFT_831522 [Paxillus rubicundulus Ve08.2h10]|uniref:Uncharacterized protein n=1 Tax=Paxillus rubicundulus Ve08.2h10 TaxID=930991 RepID=A0A0D0D2C5_9AGAM|nr:hypothetical protein PAXRUDRAFT_831522 [Paxillus rubicundulus Ve08.2h10]
MPAKRPLDVYDTPVSSTPPRGPKRRQLTGSLPPSSPSASSSAIYATPRMPGYTWIVPADSPTNPFGRICRLTQSTTLPRPTSFSKHLPLRLQLNHPRADGRDLDRDGIYRIVQVPLNYTLAHLRKLIEYVFIPATDAELIESYKLRRPSRRTSRVVSSSKGKRPELPPDPVGHLFEVQKRVVMGRPGEIKDAQTWVKASTVRDPYHYPGNESEDSLWLDDAHESEEWRWEAEEDFTLTKVWPKGGDLARGITYHHDAETHIHITVNTKKIQGRKGVGNKPYMFLASGSLSLSDPDGTLRMGSIETLRWNRIGAYEKYLKAEAEKERAARGDQAEDEDEDAEGELDPDMSSSTLPLYDFSSSPSIISSNPVTPFPTEPSLRRRVDYERKRLLKITKAGMKGSGISDDEEEVDELVGDVVVDPALEEKPSDWDPFGDEADVC